MMKQLSIILSLLFSSLLSYGQNNDLPEFVISVSKGKTRISIEAEGNLLIQVSRKDAKRFKADGFVAYADFGALGDGKKDDMDALAATHAFANRHDLMVKAEPGATYYIGGKDRTAIIRTNTSFGTAKFIIDDTDVRNRHSPVFLVDSELKAFTPDGINSLKRNQEKIDTKLPGPCLITVSDGNTRRYIRFGLNQNNGTAQTDIFLVDGQGIVDMNTPVIWDFERITDIRALPMDEKVLTISGGRFTTIANRDESKYNYYSRGFAIRRSNVRIEGMEHRITGEGEQGAPYGGFLHIADCANVTVRNTILSGHKTYRTIGSAGKPVSMGSYDISINRALNVSFINCSQTNDIDNDTYWGIMGSNFSKNLVLDSCVFSRFDAHQGVANATILNSTLGHMGINAIGTGTFRVENSTIRGRTLINLRQDYGSTWEGEFIIRDCVFVPAGGKPVTASLIGGFNTGQHDFGYTCHMPRQIYIENLHIDDSSHPESYRGPAIFSDFNPQMTSEDYIEPYPYIRTREVILKKVSTASGKKLRISDNSFMFKDVKIISDPY